ncbi:unnamed protein product (macronuclear) [Paramecium tetraurelia]|uniref:Uncharacterized protein n=1 Tax=Paramecium tetraurelia TaxID=5888 RepID=A0CKB0_PARTE|nr:uncharacterized protein GSPATT00000940001 [Paramecium tetraurelia]CAK71227.1 unnamed protein product [Paramecium tetraurelia]|eukprot:XP_001438624.1 hypothetical protein (macronuclear) [Paramecium tetraurelia strain d4-2]
MNLSRKQRQQSLILRIKKNHLQGQREIRQIYQHKTKQYQSYSENIKLKLFQSSCLMNIINILEAKSSRNLKLKRISVDYNYSIQLPNIEEYFHSQDKLQLLKTIKNEKNRVENHIEKLEKIKKELDLSDYVFTQHKPNTYHSNTPGKSARKQHTLKLNTSGSTVFGKTENVKRQQSIIDCEDRKQIDKIKEIELYRKYEKVRDSKVLPQLVNQINESYEEKNKLSDKFNRQLYYCIHNRDYSIQDKIKEYKKDSLSYSQFYSIQKRLKQHMEGRFKATENQVVKFDDELKNLAKTNRLTASRKQQLSRIKIELENGNQLENY